MADYKDHPQPVSVTVGFDDFGGVFAEKDAPEVLGKPLHIMFGYHGDKSLLSVTSDLARGVVGYSPIQLYFDKDSWRQFQEAVAKHNPFG